MFKSVSIIFFIWKYLFKKEIFLISVYQNDLKTLKKY
jgi:hypothetical protein